MQERAGAAVPGRRGRGQLVTVGAGGQDALDGPVGRIPGGDGLRAGGFEPGRVVPVGHANHALGGAQPVERTLGEQLTDDLLASPGRCRWPACGTRPGCACGTRFSPAGNHQSQSACPTPCGGGS